MDINDWIYSNEGNCSIVISNKKKKNIYRLMKEDKKDDDDVTKQVLNAFNFVEHVMRFYLGDYIPQMKLIEISRDDIVKIRECLLTDRPSYRLGKNLSLSLKYAIEMPDLCRHIYNDNPLLDCSGEFDSSLLIPSTQADYLSPGLKGEQPIIIPDLSHSTISIEIKLKWGYIGNCFNDKIFDLECNRESKSVRGGGSLLSCYFCLKQFYKLEINKCKIKSHYCPIDLFSGCRIRMKYAINELLSSPQNNLKIFKDGKILLNGDLEVNTYETEINNWLRIIQKSNNKNQIRPFQEEFTDLIIDSLLHNQYNDFDDYHISENSDSINVLQINSDESIIKEADRNLINLANEENLWTEKCSLSRCAHLCTEDCDRLPPYSILAKIKKCQSLDKDLSITAIFKIYKRLDDFFSKNPIHRIESGLYGDYDDKWLSNQLHSSSYYYENKQFSLAEDILNVKRFLVSRSVKDCSIFLTFVPNFMNEKVSMKTNDDERKNIFLTGSNNSIVCRTCVVDLDPKNLHKIPEYMQEQKHLFNLYFKNTIP